MDTLFLEPTYRDLNIAADIIRTGGNVIFPTETVYGLGANALDNEAVSKIFAAKGRPSDNPLIVHIYDRKQLPEIVREVPEKAKMLMDAFWPGPLTIILPKSEKIGDAVTAGLDTVGVRMPENEIAKDFLRYANVPVAAPSANLSGKPSPTSFGHCIEDMNGRVDAIINGGNSRVGVESTVIDMTKEPIIYRPGDITKGQIEKVLGQEVRIMADEAKNTETPPSPGLKYKHYSPNAEVYILSGDLELIIKTANRSSKRAGLLLFDEQIAMIGDKILPDVKVMSLGSMNTSAEAEAKLFAALREMDEYGVKVIFSPLLPDGDRWLAVKNRLYRAAGNVITSAAMYYNNDYMYCSECDKIGENIKLICFVCTGNTCRSPMAEGIFNHFAKERGIRYRAYSYGVYAAADMPVSENAVKAAMRDNIDLRGHKSKVFTPELAEKMDLILTMGISHKNAIIQLYPKYKDKVYTFCEYIKNPYFLDIPDPYGRDEGYYQMCYNLLKDYVIKLIDMLEKSERDIDDKV